MSNETQEKLDFILSWQDNGFDYECVREFIAELKELDEDYHTWLIEYFDEEIASSFVAIKWTEQNEQIREINVPVELDPAMVTAAERLIEHLLENDYYSWGQGDE